MFSSLVALGTTKHELSPGHLFPVLAKLNLYPPKCPTDIKMLVRQIDLTVCLECTDVSVLRFPQDQ